MSADETLDYDALFEVADSARQLAYEEDGCDNDIQAETLFDNPLSTKRMRSGCPMHIVRLSDGDYHVCFGLTCRDAVIEKNRQVVCTVSGMIVGNDPAPHFGDGGWTGRSTTSANPDDSAGVPVGGWARRRDAFSLSMDAYHVAQSIDDGDVLPAKSAASTAPSLPRPSKRGASCVDVLEEETATRRTNESASKELWTTDTWNKLMIDATTIISRLFCNTQALQPAQPASTQESLDPRLQNVEFVRRAALMRYGRNCAAGLCALTMDGIHDVCVQANEFVRQQRTLAAKMNDAAQEVAKGGKTKRTIRGDRISGQQKTSIAELIVSLWRAVTYTPYMKQGKKSNDSFRPFAAGVLYTFKRGLYLEDGTCIIPQLPTLAALLPALRCPKASVAARQLQSSSHRGVCSLLRAISSLSEASDPTEKKQIKQAFASAAQTAALLRELVCR